MDPLEQFSYLPGKLKMSTGLRGNVLLGNCLNGGSSCVLAHGFKDIPVFPAQAVAGYRRMRRCPC